jgi:hypothetical protein
MIATEYRAEDEEQARDSLDESHRQEVLGILQ